MTDRPSPLSPAPSLLADDDPPPFVVLNPEATRPLLLICDHASNRVPRALAGLGLGAATLGLHIGWDIGAAAVTELLAKRFAACAMFACYSRLVIDCNRAPGDPSSIPAVSDGIAIPGNEGLDEAEARRRTESLFWPYHHEIGERIAHLWRQGRPPAVVSIHSFTPVLGGVERPWHLGFLYNHDDRMTRRLIDTLARRAPEVIVGENEPYSGKDIGFTINTHAEPAGLPSLGVEIRQDLLADAAGIGRWAGVLGEALAEVLADEGLYVRRMT
ncbi:N-formylglutamate amidohydrolase [Rhodospirillum rubrum]|uniref:N-formylglutamate amidohydrolase n=1 Tax=Rhodospirillum rubrum TaxID=1085 RepID=UPI001903513D|nr:N-formylglutamate amidohydrolase [Rhodospirillum rubrum]MBK1665066.1 N-formylglutamate amidohydrolase [Rhodospirillum rubrum]MBK1677018.1 N-formylglutamate amidohydrolase [Rhodospirillum rubrum]